MKKFLLPMLVFGFLVSDASAQPIRRILAGERPFRDALMGQQGACGAAEALGACGTAGSCSQAPQASCGASTASVTVTTGRVSAPLGARHPVAHQFVRIKLTAGLVKTGHSWMEARAMADSLSDEVIEQAGAAVGAPGGFFQNLLDALTKCEQDPNCKKFLDMLMTYLITLLGG